MSQTSTTHMVWLKTQMVKTETSEVKISWFLIPNVGQTLPIVQFDSVFFF